MCCLFVSFAVAKFDTGDHGDLPAVFRRVTFRLAHGVGGGGDAECLRFFFRRQDGTKECLFCGFVTPCRLIGDAVHAHTADSAKVLKEGRDLLGVFGGEDKFPTDADAPVFGICVKARHRNVAEGGKYLLRLLRATAGFCRGGFFALSFRIDLEIKGRALRFSRGVPLPADEDDLGRRRGKGECAEEKKNQKNRENGSFFLCHTISVPPSEDGKAYHAASLGHRKIIFSVFSHFIAQKKKTRRRISSRFLLKMR